MRLARVVRYRAGAMALGLVQRLERQLQVLGRLQLAQQLVRELWPLVLVWLAQVRPRALAWELVLALPPA